MWNIVFANIISVVLAVMIYHSLIWSVPKPRSIKLPCLQPSPPRVVSEVVGQWHSAKQLQFDQVAQAFMQQCLDTRDRQCVFAMRDDLMSKLPATAHYELRQLSLAEWSLYFSFEQQSYEYYIGACGIFQLHVDRFGEEHKLSLWQNVIQTAQYQQPLSI